MKKPFLLFALILVILSMPFAVAIADELGYISVNTNATKEIAPNRATLKIGIETTSTTAQKASDDNKKAAQNVNIAIKKLLCDKDSIKTGEFSLSPQYTYTKDNKKVLDKYVVRNVIVINLSNVKLASKLIDTAITNGATNVEDLQFYSTDYDSICNDALVELTKQAKDKASLIAKSVNANIAGVKSINTSCNAQYAQRPYFAMMKGAMGSAVESTPVESGKIKIDANVDASFFVK